MSGPAYGSDLPREFPLVGRRAELERLFRIFGSAGPGGALRLISGEGGVGKSRLAFTVTHEAERRSWQVVRGRAYPVEQGVPYAVLADAFVPLFQGMEPATLTVLSRGREGDLRQLFPALGGDLPQMHSGLDPDELRTRLFWSFSSLIQRFVERQPLMVLLEDLHWADPSSLALIHFLVRHIDSDRFRILATCTAEERSRNPRLMEIERSLESIGRLERMDLAPFQLPEVEALLQTVFGLSGAPIQEFAERLYGWTQGNAYFVEQTLRSLVESGQLYVRDGTWLGWEARDLVLPSTIRDAILVRLRDVSPEALEAAEVMAVVGRPTPLALLDGVLGHDRDRITRAVEELVGSGTVEEEAEGRRRLLLKFHHPLTRETLYRNLSLARQRFLHGRVAGVLEGLYGEGAAEHADELAYHLARQAGSGHDGRAIRYLELAGAAALRRHADEEATAYLGAALQGAEALDGEEDAEAAASRMHRIRRLLARGETRMGRYDDARASWEWLLAEAESARDDRAAAEALRHLGLLSFWQGREAEGLEYLGSARLRVPDDAPDLAARIELATGVTLQQIGRAEESRDHIEAALARAREVGDPALLGWVHRALALIYTFSGKTAAAREHAARALELGKTAEDGRVVFWGQWAMASLKGLTGGPYPMESWLAAARRSAKELGSPVMELFVDELELEYLYFTGDWDGALALGTRAIHLARNLSQTTLLVRLLVWTSAVYIGRGDLQKAEALVNEGVETAGVLGSSRPRAGDIHMAVPALIGMATLRVAQGRFQEALDAGNAGLAIAEASGYVIWVLHLLPVVGETLIRMRRLDEAAELLVRLEEEGRRTDHPLSQVWAVAGNALVTWTSGELELGTEALLGAARTMDDIGNVYDAARIRRQAAGRLAELGRRDEALDELRRAHDVFAALGAVPELTAARKMYEELEKAPPRSRRGATEPAAQLSPREWEVAERVAARMSNKEIARELGIGLRTVTTHCTNIYKKLELDGGPTRKRTLLGDLVREGRLQPPT
ncbi:MAG: AAA family ATPase [Gemmatimonadota bacterium]